MFTFAAQMGMGISSPGGQDGTVSGYDENEKLGRIENAIRSFQSCTERIDDRLTRLEADVFANKSKMRDSNVVLQLIDSKLKGLEVRGQRFERVVSALERFVEDNLTSPGLRTELNSKLQLGMLMKSPIPNVCSVAGREYNHCFMASPGVPTRTRKNVDKLIASQKCMPVLDFPERIKSLANSKPLTSQTMLREPSVIQEVAEDQTATHDERTTPMEDDSGSVNQRSTRQTNNKRMDVPIDNTSEPIATVSRSNSASCKKLQNNPETVPKNSKKKRTTKQRKTASKSETVPDSSYANKVSSSSSQNLSKNAEAVPEITKTNRSSKRIRIATRPTVTGADSGNTKVRASRIPKRRPKKIGFKCPICAKIFPSVDAYKDDQLFHIMGPLKCHLCTFESTSKSNMWNHFNNFHPGCPPTVYPNVDVELPDSVIKPFVCDFRGCDRNFRTKKYLRHHLKSHSKASKVKAVKSGYTCTTCKKKFLNIQSYKDDQRFHLMGKLKCHICSAEIMTARYFRTHFKRAHPGCTPPELPDVEVKAAAVPDLKERAFVCPISGCAKSYILETSLNTHLKYHAGEKYKCPLCDYESLWSSSVGSHKRKVHRDALQQKESADISNFDSLLKVSETSPMKLPFVTSESAGTNPRVKDSNDETDNEEVDTNSKTAPNASKADIRSCDIASAKLKATIKSTKTQPKSSPNGFQSSLTNKHDKSYSSKQNESEQSQESEASQPGPQIPSTPPIPMNESHCALESADTFEEGNQVYACPLCSRSFSKINKLNRHFQKKH